MSKAEGSQGLLFGSDESPPHVKHCTDETLHPTSNKAFGLRHVHLLAVRYFSQVIQPSMHV